MPEVILRYARKEVFLGVHEQEIAMSAPQTEAEQRWMLQSGFNASVLTMCLQTESFSESMNSKVNILTPQTEAEHGGCFRVAFECKCS